MIDALCDSLIIMMMMSPTFLIIFFFGLIILLLSFPHLLVFFLGMLIVLVMAGAVIIEMMVTWGWGWPVAIRQVYTCALGGYPHVVTHLTRCSDCGQQHYKQESYGYFTSHDN